MPAPRQPNLFGGTGPARAYTDTTPANGYAASPGTGPQGETCGTCANCRLRTNRKGRRFYKCALAVNAWTASRGSDVLVRSPACFRWKQGEPIPTTIRTNRND